MYLVLGGMGACMAPGGGRSKKPDVKSVTRRKEGVQTGGDVVADTEDGGRGLGGANNGAATHDAGGGVIDGPRERVHYPMRTCGGFSSLAG
eukprot:CAMPEP_0184712704 /NCGR_PEP_ID=MMETSP0314-20130426/3202_1 /TAXON_ID=38298 /ORGANISM="Rhodella maculata, Strain CCMP 736" /LENGTH=90 /DNA_ID=CAMNT_0027175205 /DNA_START=81 /DNA_END=350 /DNA_ORIENTATION=-